MITRVWRGWATGDGVERYQRHYETEVLAELRAVPGFRGARLLRRTDGGLTEFVSLTDFDDLDAARRRDLGMPYGQQASVAKLVATDAAMKVTTDAVQVFGGAGYTRDYRVERYMREAKITQIFEGTNQIQRLVISRGLGRA